MHWQHGPSSSPPSPSHTDLRHVRELSEHFTVERQKRDYSHRDNRGDLMVYYAFEEEQPSSCMAAAQHQTAGGKNASGMCEMGSCVCGLCVRA